MWEIVWKCVEIGGSLDSARTASTGVERMRPLMALAVFNWTFASLLVVVADSQSAQVSPAYSSMPRIIKM